MSTKWQSADPAHPDLEIQGYKTSSGRKLLLVNKRNAPEVVTLPAEAKGARIDEINLSTGEDPAHSSIVSETTITLAPFEVAVMHLDQ